MNQPEGKKIYYGQFLLIALAIDSTSLKQK
jgi:hypothetical protein